MTNRVAMNSTANVLLALTALPVIARTSEEVEGHCHGHFCMMARNSARWNSGGRGYGLPFNRRVKTMKLDPEGDAFRAGGDDEVSYGWEDRDEKLERPLRSEMLHHTLSLSKRHMGVLGPVVQAFVRAMLDIGHDPRSRRAVGSEFAGDYPLRLHALLRQQSGQKTLRRLGVAAGLHDLIEHIVLLINRPPQAVLFADDADPRLVKMPDIVSAGRLSA
jgi:hypothetical protein